MKKMLLALRWPCLLQDVLNRRLLFQNKPAAVTFKETIPIISSFLELGEENYRAAKICGGAASVIKQKPSKHS